MLLMADYGVKLYGDAILVAPNFAQEKPDAVRAFLRAYVKALKDTMRDPALAVVMRCSVAMILPVKTSNSNAYAWRSVTTFLPLR